MALVDDLLTVLANAGAGVAGTDLFADGLPAEPDAATAVIVSEGDVPARAMGPTGAVATHCEYPRALVLARAPHPSTAAARAAAALVALDWFGGPTVVGGTRFHNIAALQRPAYPIEVDANGRHIYGFNVQLTVT